MFIAIYFSVCIILFDITEESDSSHDPMPWSYVRLEVNGCDVVALGSSRLPVDRALEQPAVLPGRRVDGVDVDHRHLLVEHLASCLQQLSRLPIKTRTLKEEPVDVNSFGWRVVDIVLTEPGDWVL